MRRVLVGDFKIGKEEKEAINKVLDSGRISEGEKVRQFEDEWAKYTGTKHCVLMSSGTSALIAGMTAIKYVGYASNNDQILTTPLTYVSTSNAIVLTGMEPVYVDVDIDTFGITYENLKLFLEKNPDNKIKAILPVHLMGYPVNMGEINKLAKENGLITIEDSAQAHGSILNGKKTGSMSLFSCFSFYIAHNIQAGEMGALNTDDPQIKEYANKIKTNGRACSCRICTRPKGICPQLKQDDNIDFDPRFSHDLIGFNFKAMEFQAALGLLQLSKIKEIIKKRQENVKYLNEGLEEFSDILKLPKYSDNVSYLAYPLVIKKPEVMKREKIRRLLEENGVETRPLFGCIPAQQPAYSFLKGKYKLPNAEYLGLNAFYVGCHQYLNREDLDYVISVFKKVLRKDL